MKIFGLGNKIIVEFVKKEKKCALIMPEEDNYSMGKVISVGSFIPCDLLSAGDAKLEAGSLIVYQTSKARALGLDFPETYFVVEVEDVVGIILQDKEKN